MNTNTTAARRLAHCLTTSLALAAALSLGCASSSETTTMRRGDDPAGLPPAIGIARLRDYETFRVSSSDPTGGNADYRAVKAGEELVLADVEGPGVITHLWFTVSSNETASLRKLVLRAWWDGEAQPAIVAPLGDFFGIGHGGDKRFFFTNAFFDVSPQLGLNCHLAMPYRNHARLTLTNEGMQTCGAVYFYVDGAKVHALPDDVAYLHARFHEENPCAAGGDYVFAEATGRGQIVGVNLSVEALADGWWGEGDDHITIDGQLRLLGTGTEDYFCGAWDFGAEHAGLYQGSPRLEPEKKGARHCVYRFHALDPIPFMKSFRYAIEHGHANDRADHWTSVAYWYQR